MILRRLYIKTTFLFSLFFLVFNTLEAKGQETWKAHAEAYIKADSLIALHGVQGKPTFLEDLERRDESVRRFRNSEPPSIQEIELLLTSEVIEEQVIACVGVMLSGDYSVTIIEELVDNLQGRKPYNLKRYSLLALKVVKQEDCKPYEDNILQAIEQESEEKTIIEGIMFLFILPPDKSSRVATNLLLSNKSDTVKIFSYAFLKKLGSAYAKRAMEELKQRGDEETLELLERMKYGNPLKEMDK